VPNVIAERSSDGATKEFSFAEIESGALLSWATEQNSNADATAVLIDQGGSASSPSVPSSEKPKIVESGSLVESYSRAILKFDGTDDGYVYSVASRPAWTVAVRCDPQAGSRQTLIDADGLLVYEDGGTVKARITDGTTTPIVTLARNKGVMDVVAAIDGSDVYLRVGCKTASTSHSISRNQSGQVAVGKAVGGGNPLQGLLSDAFAWGRLFTASERRDAFENRLRRWGPLLKPYQESDLQDVERGSIHTNVQVVSGIDPNASWGFDVPAVPIIPGNFQSNWDRPSAARRVNDNGLYESVASDTPRLQYAFGGGAEGLLVEGQARTNDVPHSTDFSEWLQVGNNHIHTLDSIVGGGGENATKVDQFIRSPGVGGGLTSSNEAFSTIIETDTSDVIRLELKQTSNNNKVILKFDHTKDTLTEHNNGFKVSEWRELRQKGPNGGRLIRIIGVYNPSELGRFTVGEPCRVQFRTSGGGGDNLIAHHTQVERPAFNASSPIVTQGSAVTRSADNYEISVGDWYRKATEMTLYMEFTHQFYYAGFPKILKAKSVNDSLVFNGESRLRIGNSIGSALDVAFNLTPYNKTKFAISYTDSKLASSSNGKEKRVTSEGWGMINETSAFSLSIQAPTVLKEMRFIPSFLSTTQRNVLTS
jgi:hypothetical protein